MTQYDNGKFGNYFSEDTRTKEKPDSSGQKTVLIFVSVYRNVWINNRYYYLKIFLHPLKANYHN